MRKMHRLPNGFGSIKKLSGARRNPYGAYPPTIDYHPNGSPVSRKAIGYYATWNEAFQALTEWNASPVKPNDMTFSECYALYLAQIESSKKEYSKSTFYSIKAAYGHCGALYGVQMRSITPSMCQKVVDGCEKKHSTAELIVWLLKNVFAFADQEGYIQRNPAKYIRVNIPDDDEKGVPFTEEEIETLWQQTDIISKTALAMIYTGFRVSALIDWQVGSESIYGGVKTGKRTVPIHPRIKPFVKSCTIASISKFRREWKAKMDSLGMHHTPHDCRHTFSWLCDKNRIDSVTKHILMGHSLGRDVEAKTYSHRTFEELKEAVEKL